MPVYVRIPLELTAPVAKPTLPAGPATVEAVLTLADQRGAAVDEANAKLRAIEALQPVDD